MAYISISCHDGPNFGVGTCEQGYTWQIYRNNIKWDKPYSNLCKVSIVPEMAFDKNLSVEIWW